MFTHFRKAVALLVFTVFSQSCEVESVLPKKEDLPQELTKEQTLPIEQAKAYIIQKDGHSSNNTIQVIDNYKIRFKAKFDNSAIYQNKVAINQQDINKLYGFSDCGSAHHTNSARFGWRWFNKQLEIFAYTYNEGQRYDQLIGTVDLNTTYEYELECKENKYIFRLNGKTVEMDRACNNKPLRYKLFPYFGGDEVAPHDITILITDLEA